MSDWIEPTDEFVMRFIASDSTTIGEYLDGGSLVEAALDDIVLYDLASGQGVAKPAMAAVKVFPNPAVDAFSSTGWWTGRSVRLINASGQTVGIWTANGQGLVSGSVSHLAPGMHWLVGHDANGALRSAPLQVN